MAESRHWGTGREEPQEAAPPPVGVLEGKEWGQCASPGERDP